VSGVEADSLYCVFGDWGYSGLRVLRCWLVGIQRIAYIVVLVSGVRADNLY
jgi:hypothetical protein